MHLYEARLRSSKVGTVLLLLPPLLVLVATRCSTPISYRYWHEYTPRCKPVRLYCTVQESYLLLRLVRSTTVRYLYEYAGDCGVTVALDPQPVSAPT